MNFVILFIILAILAVHQYLTIFYDLKRLPYDFGFRAFVFIFFVLCVINFIFMLGFFWGLVLFLATLFQLFNVSFLWIFVVPTAYKLTKIVSSSDVKPNMSVYAIFSALVPSLAILTIINFFVSEKRNLLSLFNEHFLDNSGQFWCLLTFLIIAGNIARVITQNKLRHLRRS
jgi:hypothetical protein